MQLHQRHVEQDIAHGVRPLVVRHLIGPSGAETGRPLAARGYEVQAAAQLQLRV